MNDKLDTRLREALRDLQPPPAEAEQRERVYAAVRAAAAEAEPRPSRRRPFGVFLRRPALGVGLAAAVITVAVTAFVLFGLPGTTGPEPVSASQILQRAFLAWSSGRTLQADVELKVAEWHMLQGTHTDLADRYHLYMRSDGSYRLRLVGRSQIGWSLAGGSHPAEDVAYDARTGILDTYSRARGLIERLEYPMGPPDRWAGFITEWDFSAGARALEAVGATRAETTTYQGRPVWVVTCSLGSGPSRPAITEQWPVYVITIDQKTSLPVRFQAVQDDVVMLEVRYSDLRIDGPLPREVFTLAAPRDAKVTRVNEGFRRVDAAEAATLEGYAPLMPAAVPDGYALADAAVAPSSTTANNYIKGRRVFMLQYTRGFDSLTVSTRRIADAAYAADTDPFEFEASWSKLVRREVRLTSGSFAGATAMLVVAPRTTTPHLWAVKDGVLLTVAGSATGEELVAIAESLHAIDR